MNIHVHPAASIFPLMRESELRGLIEDIREHGQREAAVMWKGQLIDGRNRMAACDELGIELDLCELEEDIDPVAWVISHNLHRRHLDDGQRALCAARARDMWAKCTAEQKAVIRAIVLADCEDE